MGRSEIFMSTSTAVGTVNWFDLTVPDAVALRDFYRAVVGWSASEVAMGGYDDFCMHPVDSSAPVAGICHARGANTDLPAQWLIYITVADLDASLVRCVESGGEVLAGQRGLGSQGRFAVIRDPAGAVAALYSPAPEGAS
jgi:uncharacterized protein